MTEKEINLAICKELGKHAQRIFGKIQAYLPAGNYTAYTIIEKLNYVDKSKYTMSCIEVKVESFRCVIEDLSRLFHILHQFEKLAYVPTKERSRFSVREERAENCKRVASFAFTITKEMAMLAKCAVDESSLRPVLENLYIDVEHSRIVASNGRVMAVFPIVLNNVEVSDDADKLSFIVPKSVITPGVYRFEQYKGENVRNTVVCLDSSEETVEAHRYPYYRSVSMFDVHPDGYFRIKEESFVNKLQKFVKVAKKTSTTVTFYGRSYSEHISAVYYDYYGNKQELILPLVSKLRTDILFTVYVDGLIMLKDWDGGVWWSPDHNMIFDGKHCDLIVVCKAQTPEHFKENIVYPSFDADQGVNTYRRHGGWPRRIVTSTTESKPKAKAKPKPRPKPKAKKPIIQQSIPDRLYMGHHYYKVWELEEGTYPYSGELRPELRALIRNMARVIRSTPEHQVACIKHWATLYTSADEFDSLFPLSEQQLAEDLYSYLHSVGIEDVPDYYQPETAKEEGEKLAAEVSPSAVDLEIVPIITLETTDGPLRVAAESLMDRLYDRERGEFRSDAAARLFESIDAFIPDHLVESPLDVEAIALAVQEFFAKVETAV